MSATVTDPSTQRRSQASKAVAFPRRARPVAGARSNSRAFTAFCIVVLTVFALIWLVPLLWAGVTSVRPEGEIAEHPLRIWSSHYTLGAYRNVINTTSIWDWYLNSFVVSVLSVALTVFVCSLIGFAIARTDFRGRSLASGLILAGLMIPSQVLILPQFQEFRLSHLLNTYWAIVLVAVPAPVAVFVFAAFLRGIPESLIESARLDGAGWWRIYARICMPLCKPAISAVSIFTFVSTWNNFLWPLLVLSNTQQMTIPVGLATVQGGFGVRYPEIMASSVLGLLPLLVVFLFFQRRIVQGVASTGIK